MNTELTHIHLQRPTEGVLEVVMKRPPANALNRELIGDLTAVAETVTEDRTVRVVVLRSDSPMFMAGADLKMVDGGWQELTGTIRAFQEAGNRWQAIPVPTIAVIGGHALGAGCELALTCDFRLMATGRPRIGLPESQRGLLPGGGGTQRMARLIGTAHALDLCLRGSAITAERAERLGLITEAVEPLELDSRARALTDELLALPTMTLRAIKRCIRDGVATDLESGLAIELDEMVRLGDTEDTREGVRAFVEKRDPVFAHR